MTATKIAHCGENILSECLEFQSKVHTHLQGYSPTNRQYAFITDPYNGRANAPLDSRKMEKNGSIEKLCIMAYDNSACIRR
jgi:hypothetical protein